MTCSENVQHAYDTGLAKNKKGWDSLSARLTEADVSYIRNSYTAYSKVYGCRALARKFKVSHSTILKVLNNISYITEEIVNED